MRSVSVAHQRQKPSSSDVKGPSAAVIVSIVACCQRARNPIFKAIALTDERNLMIQTGKFAQRRRRQDAARRVEFGRVGVADHQPLHGAVFRLERRQAHQPGLDRLPLGLRIDEEAAAAIDGDHHRQRLAVDRSRRRKRVAVPRRDREPALGVERKMGDATKNRARHPTRCRRSVCRHPPLPRPPERHPLEVARMGRKRPLRPTETHRTPRNDTIRQENLTGQRLAVLLTMTQRGF